MRIPLLILLLSFGLCIQTQAQKGALEKAAKFEEQYNLGPAIDIYERLAEKGNGEAMARLGKIALRRKDYQQAQRWLVAAAENGAEGAEFAWNSASLFLTLDSTRLAMQWLVECIQLNPDDERAKAFIDFQLENEGGPVDSSGFSVRRMPFNSTYADYAPARWGDGLLFTSERPNMDAGVEYLSAVTGLPHTNIYGTSQRDSSNWTRAKGLDGLFNTRFNEGAAAMSPDSQVVYFTRTVTKRKAKTSSSQMRIMEIRREKGGWTKPMQTRLKSGEASYAYPAVSPDGQYLYFASDIPGGYGGMDLYRCSIGARSFGPPQNLGPGVNTAGNEIFPALQGEDLLYFSSDGQAGHGGLDIFYSYNINGQWMPAQNAGRPLNSRWDDFSIIITPEGDQAFLATNRHTQSRDFDIYEFFIPERPFEDCKPQKETSLCFTLFEGSTTDSLPYQMIYEWDLGDGTRKEGARIRHCFPDTGVYTVSLRAIDSVTRDVMLIESTYDLAIKLPVQAKISGPDTAIHRRDLNFHGLDTYLPNVQIRKYEWDFGDGEMAQGSSVEHRYKDPGEYMVRLGVRGINKVTGRREAHCITKPIVILHKKSLWTPSVVEVDPYQQPYTPSTDTLGNADAVKAFEDSLEIMAQTGLVPPVMKYRSNPRMQTVKIDLESGQAVPRGSKLVFINLETGKRQLVKRISPNAKSIEVQLPRGMRYSYHVEAEGHFPVSKNIDITEGRLGEVYEDTLRMVTVPEMADGRTKVQLENIFFDFDQATLRPESFQELSRVLRFLRENPLLNIQIEGHTDQVGSHAYNLRLSEQRASTVVRFFVLNGCSPARLTARGYGETRPADSNSSPQARALNRRVELKVIPNTDQSSK